MKFLNKIFGREDAVTIDARRIYSALMSQSRKPEFYGPTRFEDNYDGRIDVLTLHIAAVLSNLNRFGENGERLGQARAALAEEVARWHAHILECDGVGGRAV